MKEREKEIIELKEIKSALELNRERLAFVLEGSQLGFWDWNIETGEVQRNERWANMLGYSFEEVKRDVPQWQDLIHPEDRESAWQSIMDHLEGRSPAHKKEYRMLTKSGEYIWILDQARIVSYDSEGKPLRMSGTHTDISEQKETEEKIRSLLQEKELILKESHHRIKNNMGVIKSLLSIQAGNQADTPCGVILADAAGRINSMIVLYEKLYQTENTLELNVKEYFESLVSEILTVNTLPMAIRTELEFEDFSLSPSIISPLGIMINEMISNSIKHAFKDVPEPFIRLKACRREDTFFFEYQDNGPGMNPSIDWRNSQSFGLQLIRLLADQVRGKLNMEKGAGTRFTLSIPRDYSE